MYSTGKAYHWYINSYTFALGCIVSIHKKKIFVIIKNYYLLISSLLGILLSCYLLFEIKSLYIQAIIGAFHTLLVSITICIFSSVINIKSSLFEKMGEISYEIFLLGTGFIILYYKKFESDAISPIIIFVIVTIISKIVQKLSKYISKFLFENKMQKTTENDNK
jgi:peptidoglycan/LPS O-acetylase OafA/YrhL